MLSLLKMIGGKPFHSLFFLFFFFYLYLFLSFCLSLLFPFLFCCLEFLFQVEPTQADLSVDSVLLFAGVIFCLLPVAAHWFKSFIGDINLSSLANSNLSWLTFRKVSLKTQL